MLVVKLTQRSQHTPLEDSGCLNDWNEVMCVEMFGKLCLTWKINIEIRDQTKPCLHPFSQDCSWWNCDNQAPYGLSHSLPFWALSQNNTAPSPCEPFTLLPLSESAHWKVSDIYSMPVTVIFSKEVSFLPSLSSLLTTVHEGFTEELPCIAAVSLGERQGLQTVNTVSSMHGSCQGGLIFSSKPKQEVNFFPQKE